MINAYTLSFILVIYCSHFNCDVQSIQIYKFAHRRSSQWILTVNWCNFIMFLLTHLHNIFYRMSFVVLQVIYGFILLYEIQIIIFAISYLLYLSFCYRMWFILCSHNVCIVNDAVRIIGVHYVNMFTRCHIVYLWKKVYCEFTFDWFSSICPIFIFTLFQNITNWLLIPYSHARHLVASSVSLLSPLKVALPESS